jgi:hypothetical protein
MKNIGENRQKCQK